MGACQQGPISKLWNCPTELVTTERSQNYGMSVSRASLWSVDIGHRLSSPSLNVLKFAQDVCSPAADIETRVKRISPFIQESQLSGRGPVPTSIMEPPGEASGSSGRDYWESGSD